MWPFLIPPPLGQPHSLPRGVQVHAGYFHVSIIHQTLTWTTGSLTCVHSLLYACIYTRGLDTLTASQHNLFDSEKLKSFYVSFRSDDNLSSAESGCIFKAIHL